MDIVVRSKVPASKIKPWDGKHPTTDHYDMVIDGNVRVLDSKGKVVIQLVRGEIPEELLDQSYPAYDWLKKFVSDNRAKYAGAPKVGTLIKSDGSRSKSSRALNEDGSRFNVSSVAAGYYERQGGRNPFCRATMITKNHKEKWDEMVPLLQHCGKLFKRNLPIQWRRQMNYVDKAHPAWIIKDTPYTTITVNNSVCAAYHQDAGDLKEGFGAMVVMRKGDYKGFELVVPEYKLAVNMRHGDLLFFNPCIWHGNIPPYETVGVKNKDWQRISIVMYYREGILGCKSPKEELDIAKKRSAL